MTEDEQNKVYNTIGLAPNLSMPVKGDASSTTRSVVAAGTIDIRENKAQDISALSRNTANSLNELGKIFDKAKIEEQQELAAVFGEEAFRLVHNLKDDGSGRKIAIHFALGGIMSAITGAGFASGAIGAGLNEALINNLKGLDPGTAQIVSGIIGAAAAKVVGGNALAGASAAASGTKWNKYQKDPRIKEKLQEILKNEKFDDLKEKERIIVVKQDENGNTISVSVDSEGNLKDLDLPPEYADAYPEIKNGAVIVRRVTLGPATDDGNTFTVSWGEKDGHISNLIPEPNQLKDRGQQTFSFEKFSFTTHKVLDFLGYIPAVGSAASIADGILYVADGNYEEAIRSVGMIIPGAKYLKAAKKLTGVLGISSFIRAKKNIPSHLSSEKSSVFDKRGTSQIPKKNSNDSDIPQSGLPPKEANKNLFPPGATDKGFDSFTTLKKYLGSAGENMRWHHIVEQSQIKSSRAGFAPEQIHNVGDVIALPSGKGSIHS